MKSTPILFLGDSPTLPTGLGRIGHDLAQLLSSDPLFRVGYMGRGGVASRHLPYPQYIFEPLIDDHWGERIFQKTLDDFFGKEQGIVFTIWDPSRLDWLAIGDTDYGAGSRFKLWGYFPVDAEGCGPGGALTGLSAATIAKFDRILAYTKFGKRVLESSTQRTDIQWMPHGFIRTERNLQNESAAAFKVRQFLYDPHAMLTVGCVMSNQARKDWGVAALTLKLLAETRDVKAWWHVDSIDRYWDLRGLVSDFKLEQFVRITTDEMSDQDLAGLYAECDVTILPSLGEGFGYPIVESLAQGVPVIHVNYAGGAELIKNKDDLVPVREWRIDTRQSVVRPVLSAHDFVDKITTNRSGYRPPELRESVAHLEWTKLWPHWNRWFREGIGGG